MIREDRLTVTRLCEALLERIAARDQTVAAWSFIDPNLVLSQARKLDAAPNRGPLHGAPIGVKDIIFTADMPTQFNSALYEGFHPRIDAPCVRILRRAGALILGKNDTVEFAVNGRRARTRNPHDPSRTPGGSSSGSAAAVADFQALLSIGTQTGGSVIRPASYCGVFAMKPTWNAVNAEGMKVCSVTMDTLGWYGRSADDLVLLCDVFGVEDDIPHRARSLSGARIALCRTPVWSQASAATRAAMEAAQARLSRAGAAITELVLDDEFGALTAAHKTIMQSEMRASFLAEHADFGDGLYAEMRSIMPGGARISRSDLVMALDLAARCRMRFDALAADYDAILTPSAPDEAPPGPQDTGAATFNRIWTLLHTPCVNVPGLLGPNHLPIGVTLTGPRFSDRRILSLARAAHDALRN